VRKVASRSCAFVTYATRAAAERAAEEMANKLVVKGQRLKLLWGKPQAPRPAEGGGAAPQAPYTAGHPPTYMPAAPGSGYYPSMDPMAMGSYQQRQQQQQQQGNAPGRPAPPPGGPPPPVPAT
jgi:pre-mRNA-splicing factor RBM22/SLT11